MGVQTNALARLLDRPARVVALDGAAERISSLADRLLPAGRARDLLQGRPLGHPAHPALAQVPLGTSLSVLLLDAATVLHRGRRTAGHGAGARLLTTAGVVSVVPTAAAGWADFSDLHEDQKRTALVHAIGNVTAAALWTLSLVVPRRAVLLRTSGTVAAGLAGALGGHLAHRWSAGVNHAEHVPHTAPDGWYDVGAVADLPEGRPQQRRIGQVAVCVVRQGLDVAALADGCSHLSGPLHDGELTTVDGESCIVCPWHGSTFRWSDGAVVAGPATAPQPRVDIRIVAGRVHARVVPLRGVPMSPALPGAEPVAVGEA